MKQKQLTFWLAIVVAPETVSCQWDLRAQKRMDQGGDGVLPWFGRWVTVCDETFGLGCRLQQKLAIATLPWSSHILLAVFLKPKLFNNTQNNEWTSSLKPGVPGSAFLVEVFLQ